jgi:hypothetical protein
VVRGGNSVFKDEVTFDEVLELFGGLHGGPGPALSYKPLGSADKLGGSGDGTSRAGSGSAALGDKTGGVGPSHGEDGIRKATVVGKGRNAQKAIQKVGDRHLPREEVGTDERGQDVEGEVGIFRGARAIEVDYPQKSLDKKKERVPPSAMNQGQRAP